MATQDRLSREHPVRARLRHKFPQPLKRSCGLPGCDNWLTVDLFAPETTFRGGAYCTDEHQEVAKRHRKRLRTALAEIDHLLTEPEATQPPSARLTGLTRAELKRWQRRLTWELDGMPRAD